MESTLNTTDYPKVENFVKALVKNIRELVKKDSDLKLVVSE
jgi:hypothetical protein